MNTSTYEINTGVLIAYIVVGLALVVVGIVAGWKVFTKAGQPGWAIIIPFYNTYVLLKIVGRPGWWLVLMFIPLVNIVVAIIVAVDLAKSFGKGGVFAFFGLILFSFIGYCILGFGSARYLGPAAAPQGGGQPPYPPPQQYTPPGAQPYPPPQYPGQHQYPQQRPPRQPGQPYPPQQYPPQQYGQQPPYGGQQ